MHLLKKDQILRLVEALSKVTIKKLNKITGRDTIDFNMAIIKAKFKGFSGSSFEKGLVAVYECKTETSGNKLIIVYVNWNGKDFSLARNY